MSDKTVPGITHDDILSMLDEFAPPRQQPGDVTVTMMMERWKCSDNTARARLKKLAEQGKLVKIENAVLDTGVRGYVFRIPDKP